MIYSPCIFKIKEIPYNDETILEYAFTLYNALLGEERIKISKAGKKNRYASYIIRLERVNSKQYRNLNNFTKYTKRIGERQAVDIIYPKISEETQYINKYIEDDI